jgi:hypothetical protein
VPPVPAPHSAEFGYAVANDDFWEMGFLSREEAISAAAALCADRKCVTYKTAKVIPHEVGYPDDIVETLADGLANGGRIGNLLVEALVSANEKGNFEGEFEDACWLHDRTDLGNAGRKAFANALIRVGEPRAAEAVLSSEELPEIELPDDVYRRLSADTFLTAEVGIALRDYVSRNSLYGDLRGIMTLDIVAHSLGTTVTQDA